MGPFIVPVFQLGGDGRFGDSPVICFLLGAYREFFGSKLEFLLL